MDQKQIEKLMAAMEHSRIKRIVIKREDFEIEIERECALTPATPFSLPPSSSTSPVAYTESKHKSFIDSNMAVERKETNGGSSGLYVDSPMVGTFYASPSPDDPPFVKAGDTVDEDTVVCIIEAMKVMNEVKAGTKGSVVEVLLKNGEPVEFGTHIFKISGS